MNDPANVPIQDLKVREIIKILGETIGLEGDSLSRKRHLMERLCHMVHADCWTWSLGFHPYDSSLHFLLKLHGGFDHSSLAMWTVAIEKTELRALLAGIVEAAVHSDQIIIQKSNDPACQLPDPSALEESWQSAKIGAYLLAVWPLPDGSISIVGLYRALGAAPFERQDSNIARMLLSEIPWLHQDKSPPSAIDPDVPLHPRHRTILNLLVQAWSRKMISAELGIATDTVQGYVKDIYRHFKVHSQPELIIRLSHGKHR